MGGGVRRPPFRTINMAKHLWSIDAALAGQKQQVRGRFREVERLVAESSRPWSSFTTEELDRLWEE